MLFRRSLLFNKLWSGFHAQTTDSTNLLASCRANLTPHWSGVTLQCRSTTCLHLTDLTPACKYGAQ